MKIIAWIIAALCVLGCSSSKKDAETAAEPETAVQTADPTPAPVFEMPYTLSISGKMDGETAVVTLTIDYRIAIPTAPILVIKPHGDTIVNQPLEQTLDIPKEIGIVTKEIRLTGTRPGIDVSLSLTDAGFGIEVHESWPPKPELRGKKPREPLMHLPAPVEIEGNVITHGVEVK